MKWESLLMKGDRIYKLNGEENTLQKVRGAKGRRKNNTPDYEGQHTSCIIIKNTL